MQGCPWLFTPKNIAPPLPTQRKQKANQLKNKGFIFLIEAQEYILLHRHQTLATVRPRKKSTVSLREVFDEGARDGTKKKKQDPTTARHNRKYQSFLSKTQKWTTQQARASSYNSGDRPGSVTATSFTLDMPRDVWSLCMLWFWRWVTCQHLNQPPTTIWVIALGRFWCRTMFWRSLRVCTEILCIFVQNTFGLKASSKSPHLRFRKKNSSRLHKWFTYR